MLGHNHGRSALAAIVPTAYALAPGMHGRDANPYRPR